jgi:hypothetical protein
MTNVLSSSGVEHQTYKQLQHQILSISPLRHAEANSYADLIYMTASNFRIMAHKNVLRCGTLQHQ